MAQHHKNKIKVQVISNGEIVQSQTFNDLPISIGRNSNSNICLSDYNFVSGTHATIQEIDGCLCVVDMGSTNGIQYKGAKVTRQQIYDGIEVEVKSLKIIITYDAMEATAYSDEKIDEKTDEKTAELTDLGLALQTTGRISFEHKAPSMPELSQAIIQKIPINKLALESSLVWKGEVLERHVHYKGEALILSNHPENGLHLPMVKKDVPLAFFTGIKTKLNLPKNSVGKIKNNKDNSSYDVHEMVEYAKNNNFSRVSFVEDQELELYLGSDVYLLLRHIEAPIPFSQVKFLLPEKLFKKALKFSSILHIALIVIGLIAIPKVEAPKVKNLPPRIARLLVKKPKPKEIVKKPKPIKKKVIAKKKPIKKKAIVKKAPVRVTKPKKRYKPKKIIVKHNKRMKKVNKFPFTVKTKNIAKRPSKGFTPKKKTDVKKVGALAALGALGKSSPNPSNKPVAININPNAGGRPGKLKVNSVIGALRTKSGKLAAGGSGSLKTTGKGYGTGTGYGVQGIKGRAGGRGVSATVVGSPSLMKISRSEGLSNKQVMKIVKKHAGKISSCYERALLNNPGLNGRVEYEWKIKPTGKVSWAKVKKSNIQRSSELNNCVVAVFKAMKFPRAKNGQATIPNIGFPFGRF